MSSDEEENYEDSISDISLIDYQEKVIIPTKQSKEMSQKVDDETPLGNTEQLTRWESLQPVELLEEIDKLYKAKQKGCHRVVKDIRQVLEYKIFQLENVQE